MKRLVLIFMVFVHQFAIAQEEVTLQSLKSQIDQLEQNMKTEKEKPKYSFFGDFRLRHHNEHQESQDQRTLERFQLKIGAQAEIQNDLIFFTRLMTGTSATNGNITLGDNRSSSHGRKSIGIDWAYLQYKPTEYLEVLGGKMASPLSFAGRNQLILDRDISPEGLGFKIPFTLNDAWSTSVTGLSAWNVERYDSTNTQENSDSLLNALQGNLKWKTDQTSAALGVGTFTFSKVKNMNPGMFLGGTVDNDAKGNSTYTSSTTGNQVYRYGYALNEYSLELKHKFSKFELSVFTQQVENLRAQNRNQASVDGFGLSFEEYSLFYSLLNVGKDSVMALFADSDFGKGTSSSRGSIVQLNYKPNSKMSWVFTVYDNEINLDTAPTQYKRNTLDLTVNF